MEQVLSTVTGRGRRGRVRRTETARAHVLSQTTSHAATTADATVATRDAGRDVGAAATATATAHPVQVPETVEHARAVY